jgi:hypothetical protein
VLGHYTADNGAIYEGANYWGYSARYLVRMLSGLEGVLGSDFGSLSSKDGLSESGVVPMHMTGPTNKMFNFGDALPYEKAGAELFWFARRYNRPVCAWFERKFCNDSADGPEALDLLWYDPRGSNPSLESVSPDVYFRGATTPTSPAYDALEAGVFREKWNDSRATYLGFKGGHLGEQAHTDLDAGSFVLYANGKNWALDLGLEDYSLPGVLNANPKYDFNRWLYYRKRAEGHNTLVINPGSGPDQQLQADCPIQFWCSSPDGDGSASVVDLTSAYKSATKVRRGFRLLNGRHDVIVQDEISLSTSSTVWWFMHFNSNITTYEIAADGRSATLTQGNERLWCKILSGDKGVFTVEGATPLSGSPKPDGQNGNSDTRKLSIRLSGIISTQLTVYFKPLASGDPIPEPAALPAVTSLDEWVVSGINDPPTISDVATQATTENIATAALPFTVGDDLTAPGSLTLTKSSSDPTLVPPANIVFGGSGANRTVTVTPAANQSGTTYITLTVSDGTHTASDGFWLTVGDAATPQTLSVPLAASADDAEESAIGTVDLTSTHLELPNARGPIATTGGSDPLVGLRFAGLPIPQGATITHAAIQFTAAGTQSETTTLDITVEATDQAAAFSATTGNLSNRPITDTRLVWQPPAWSVLGEATASQRTPNLAGILQDIISRPGWASGNAIALFIKGAGRRTADAFDKSGGTPPRLSVTYVIEPTASFTQWLTTYPSLTGTNALGTADPDGDAFNNLLEYALATHPTQANAAPYTTALAGSTLAFTYARPSLAPDLIYAVEWSRTLAAGTWSTTGVTQQITSDNGTIRTVRAAVPAGTEALFLRLKVTAP